MKTGGDIVLVGMMGAGKTTVGKILARRLKRRFLDSDQEIERRCGVRIPVIFEIEGEDGFRAREAGVLAELLAEEGLVLATGGGAVLRPETRRLLAARALVIYLHGRPQDLLPRLRHDRNRPLLAGADRLGRLEELYAARDPLYREVADLVAETGRQSPQSLARSVLQRLDERWKLSA